MKEKTEKTNKQRNSIKAKVGSLTRLKKKSKRISSQIDWERKKKTLQTSGVKEVSLLQKLEILNV